MNEYLLSVAGTVLICALLTALAPEGKTASVIKGIARLVCILAIISPVLRFFQTGEIDVFSDKKEEDFFLETVIDGDGTYIQYYSELRIAETERLLEKELFDKYKANAEVELAWSRVEKELDTLYATSEIQIESVCIRTAKEIDEEVKAAMCEYVRENYCSEVLLE